MLKGTKVTMLLQELMCKVYNVFTTSLNLKSAGTARCDYGRIIQLSAFCTHPHNTEIPESPADQSSCTAQGSSTLSSDCPTNASSSMRVHVALEIQQVHFTCLLPHKCLHK